MVYYICKELVNNMNEVQKIKKEFLEAISILENKNFERLPKKEDVDSFTLKELVKIVCLYKTASSRISLIEEKLRRISDNAPILKKPLPPNLLVSVIKPTSIPPKTVRAIPPCIRVSISIFPRT